MPFKFNPITGLLDLVNPVGTGSGDVIGPASSHDKAIARFSGTTGKIIQDSNTLVQDGGGIQAQAFLTNRVIDELVTVPSNYTMIAANIEIEDGEIVIESDGEVLIL